MLFSAPFFCGSWSCLRGALAVPPVFWALLQKNGPKFDVTPNFWAVFEGLFCVEYF